MLLSNTGKIWKYGISTNQMWRVNWLIFYQQLRYLLTHSVDWFTFSSDITHVAFTTSLVESAKSTRRDFAGLVIAVSWGLVGGQRCFSSFRWESCGVLRSYRVGVLRYRVVARRSLAAPCRSMSESCGTLLWHVGFLRYLLWHVKGLRYRVVSKRN